MPSANRKRFEGNGVGGGGSGWREGIEGSRVRASGEAAQEEGVEKLARLFDGKKEARKTIPIRKAADQ